MPNITIDLLVIEIKRRLQQRRSDAAVPSRTDDLEGIVADAGQKLCERAKVDGTVRRLLSTSYAPVALDGAGKAEILTTWPDLFAEAVEIGSRVTIEGSPQEAVYFENFGDFQYGTPRVDTPRFTTLHGFVYARTANDDQGGKLITIENAITVPKFTLSAGTSTLHPSLENDFFEIVTELQMQRAGR